MTDNSQQTPQALDLKEVLRRATAILKINAVETDTAGRMPYFTKHHADELGALLLQVVQSGAPTIIPLAHKGTMRKETTLRLVVSQARKYLLEVEDFKNGDGRWADIVSRLSFKFLPRRGMRIEPKREYNSLQGLIIQDWKPDFMEFIQNCPEPDTASNFYPKFERLGLFVEAEDIQWARRMLLELKSTHNFLLDIQEDHIIVIRIPCERKEDDNKSTA